MGEVVIFSVAEEGPEGWSPSELFAGEWHRVVRRARPCREGEVPYVAILRVTRHETVGVHRYSGVIAADGSERVVVGGAVSLRQCAGLVERAYCGCYVVRR